MKHIELPVIIDEGYRRSNESISISLGCPNVVYQGELAGRVLIKNLIFED
jgi:hypothetical protein